MEVEALYDQIEDGVEFVANINQPYSLTQIVQDAYNLVFHTGTFGLLCRKWKYIPAVDCTWVNFKIHLSLSHKIIRISKSSARTVRLGAANALMAETATQRVKLTTNTSNNCMTINKLTRTNQHLVMEASTADTI